MPAHQLSWVKSSGRGKVWSWTVMHQRYFAALETDLKHNTAVVELDEGPRLKTTLIDVSPDHIHCDVPVVVVFDDVTPEITLPKLRSHCQITANNPQPLHHSLSTTSHENVSVTLGKIRQEHPTVGGLVAQRPGLRV